MTSDRLMLDTILDSLAQDRPEGLNLPGVARLIRRCLSAREQTREDAFRAGWESGMSAQGPVEAAFERYVVRAGKDLP